MHATFPLLKQTDFPPIRRKTLDTLQVNLGYKCNQTCQHCHVNAGPNRKEMMDADTIALVLRVLHDRRLSTLDLTGGAPELNRHFRDLVRQARKQGVRVIDRCNLTILFEPGHEDLAAFLAEQQVEVTASLPCYTPSNVDRQRGEGVFEKSIAALRKLNSLGYGREEGALRLSLVYNPLGPYLPPAQQKLQADYKRELAEHFGIAFNQLYVLANMPIQRFGSMLVSNGQFQGYMKLLKDNFSAGNLDAVMCRNLVSVDWQGFLYDCDFNQMLGMNMHGRGAPRLHLRDLLGMDVEGMPITIANHCYGCTAGQGSSCGGALVA
ncbi:MAG TPA: arsenosugar biosynthesis radical SAM (seleno)protein ArsS [Noviherbaspirillum sp.]|uniref:arsenosugar biosynthesis radical SAM (seleno)protein ArsS n=1 Tax=Noviherbaspirillum sp. TaxID=1926288 RepID=UPI002D74FB63|nr:arsenosugar biosynthesis radical SAM (seleno)protein ArsS [Noviherbaspirillum sp.]HYD96578.1 arsenosugar biosynthesis radical SAM (seleno)protein ArsS [Noviherbaspirillum sp.]